MDKIGKRTIQAADCSFERISEEEAENFIEIYHPLGPADVATSIFSFGFRFKGELLSVIQFCYPRSELKRLIYSAELLRLATKFGVNLPDSFSHLIEAYIINQKPADFFYSASDDETAPVIYEWFDTERTYYTYKITASDSEKYYYGVSHLKRANASERDCLTDNYWGSGSTLYSNWRQKHADVLKKEVIGIYSRKVEAFLAEADLVGNLYREDPNCLNSVRGGLRPLHEHRTISIQFCSVHGETNHTSSGICLKCASSTVFSEGICDSHGSVTLRAGVCEKCRYAKSRKEGICETHGAWSAIQGCSKCIAELALKIDECEIHGSTIFRGARCARCNSLSMFSEGSCGIHGSVTLQDGKCVSCRVARMTTAESCTVHGESIHQGGVCRKCVSSKIHRQDICKTHGETTFRGDYCLRCVNGSGMEEQECSKHGLTIHHKGKCRRCQSEKMIVERECPTHGMVKHQGEHCLRCKRAQEYSVMECSIHGEVKHRNGKCQTCAAAEQKDRRAMKEKEVIVHDSKR